MAKPSGSFFDILRFRHDPLGFLTRMAKRGDIAYFGPRGRLALVSHPDLIREVLVTQAAKFTKSPMLRKTKATLGDGLLTSEGDFHKRQRRTIQPAFHATHVAVYGQSMVDFSLRTSGRWIEGQTIDVHEQMARLTLEIVAKTLFDAEVEADLDAINKAMTASVEMFTLLMLPGGGTLARLPLPRSMRFARTWPALTRTIERFIQQRKSSGTYGNDLLSILLRAADPESGGTMSEKQVRDEAITLFTAGHETTANALTFTLHLVAHHPAVQEMLHEELKQVLGDRPPEASDVERLPYVRAAISEAMRIYPPVWTIGRQASEPVQIGDEPLLRKDQIVLTSQWVAHHDGRWWPDPMKYDPNRWLDGSDSARPRYAYFPFAGGPRNCIGESFAWMEMILVVATIVQRWRLHPISPRELPLAPSITLRPRGAVNVRLTKRTRDVPESRCNLTFPA